MADSRRLLLELIDDLLVDVRSVASGTKALPRVVLAILHLDLGKARQAAGYLKERSLSGHADCLLQDVERLKQKADEALRGPSVVHPSPDDLRQELRDLATLHSEARDLLNSLNELRSLIVEDDQDVTPPVPQPAEYFVSATDAVMLFPDDFTDTNALKRYAERKSVSMEKPSKQRLQIDLLSLQRAMLDDKKQSSESHSDVFERYQKMRAEKDKKAGEK